MPKFAPKGLSPRERAALQVAAAEEQKWAAYMDSVRGVPGRDGVDGAPGRDGVDGKDGKDGADGKDGRDGVNGLDGLPGEHGKDGRDGADGKDGRDGVNGLDGAPGVAVAAPPHVVATAIMYESAHPLARAVGVTETLSDGSTRVRKVKRDAQGRPIGLEQA